MIGFKSIADKRLDFALRCLQEVIDETESFLSEEERRETPVARKKLNKGRKPSEVAKNYHQYIKSFGMLMLNSGLVAALLFAQGKANKGDKKAEAYDLIIKHLTEWLQSRGCVSQPSKAAILELYGANSPHHIRQATREALMFLQDLKRVADARLQKPEKSENGDK
jgi:CRISPR type III-B/RAMP module-associated protein Cmr5